MSRIKKLVGENVYLSPLSLDDTEVFAQWMNDFQVTDYTGRSAHIYSIEAEKKWLENEVQNAGYLMSIVTLDGDKVIGNISLNNVDNINRSATLGILIGDSENRNKGYGTEAIRLLLDFGFNYLNLNSVILTVLECNARAIKCYEKVGFKMCGRTRKCKFVNGKYYDLIYMDILADEFEGEYIKNKNV